MENNRDGTNFFPTTIKQEPKYVQGLKNQITEVQQVPIFSAPFNPPKNEDPNFVKKFQPILNNPNTNPSQGFFPVPKQEMNKGPNPQDFAKNNQTFPMPQKSPFGNIQENFRPKNVEGPSPSPKPPQFHIPSNLNTQKTTLILPNTQIANPTTNIPKFDFPSNKNDQGLNKPPTFNQPNIPSLVPSNQIPILVKNPSANPQFPPGIVPPGLKLTNKPPMGIPETQFKGQSFSGNLIKNPEEIQKPVIPAPQQLKTNINLSGKHESNEKVIINPTQPLHFPSGLAQNLNKGFEKVGEKKCPESGKIGPSEYKPDFNKGVLQSKDDDIDELPCSEHNEICDLPKPALVQKETKEGLTNLVALKPNSTVKLYLKMIGLCAKAADLKKINKKEGLADLKEKKRKVSQKDLKEIKEILCIKCQELKIPVVLQCTHIECFNCFKQNAGNFISNPSQKTFKKASCKSCYINYNLEDIEKILGNDTLQNYKKQNPKTKCTKCGLSLNLQTNYFSELDCLHLCGVCYSTELLNGVKSCFFCGEAFHNLNSTNLRKSSCELCHKNCCEAKCSCKFATVNQMCHTLPCGHTLCFLCTVNKDAKSDCPICNQETKLDGRLRIFLQVMRFCVKCKNTLFILENQSLQCPSCSQDPEF